MTYTPQVRSVMIHGVLAVIWYYYSGLIVEVVNGLSQHWIINAIILIMGCVLFAFLYVKLSPKKYNLTIGWFAGFFPVLFILMVFVY